MKSSSNMFSSKSTLSRTLPNNVGTLNNVGKRRIIEGSAREQGPPVPNTAWILEPGASKIGYLDRVGFLRQDDGNFRTDKQ